MDGVICEYRADATLEDMERDGYFRTLRPRTDMWWTPCGGSSGAENMKCSCCPPCFRRRRRHP